MVSVAKPNKDNYHRHKLSVSTEVPTFIANFQKLEALLKHCKTALTGMERPDGTLAPFPETEFVLSYGQPSLWSSWHEMAKFAKYKVQSEGFLNVHTDCWSKYALRLREWALNQVCNSGKRQ